MVELTTILSIQKNRFLSVVSHQKIPTITSEILLKYSMFFQIIKR